MKRIILLCLFLSGCGSQEPSILIIGDSISLGYTPFVQEQIAGIEHAGPCIETPYQKVNKQDNSEGSAHQAACIKQWLAAGNYSIVHFNAGIWDSNQCGSNQASNLSDYLNNLQIEVDAIRESGAKPIFATTTPVLMPNQSCADESTIESYNAAAVQMMKSQGIQVDDIYSLMISHQDLHKSPTNVHWKDSGYKIMAQSVTESIQGKLTLENL